ncbi:MAG: plasmid replication protein RepC [Salipiger thiooxidans]|uniref:plasmid replication protein RepC n=1 Tax=Salipiger thiooxidans TaxID=282683 RepID=UPI001CFAD89F|nr:plasmid replication protein RepC [Salipiger thiooxidans]
MGYHPITPFGRTAKAVLTSLQVRQPVAAPPCPLDKWQILRDLTAARARFGLSDRDITLLQALLSFHPGTRLDASEPLVIHPSNETICARANGMPCSTMRRHLARLVEAGLLVRRDSPNGKRYARRIAGTKVAFGFDLSPLLHRAAEIADEAASARALEQQRKALRETASLLRRDLAALVEFGAAEHSDPLWDAFSDLARLTARQLRRKLDVDTLRDMVLELHDAVTRATALFASVAPEMSSNDARNEQHKQSSHKDNLDSEQTARSDDASVTDALYCSTVEALGSEAEKSGSGVEGATADDAENIDDVTTGVNETTVKESATVSEVGALQRTTPNPIGTGDEGMAAAQQISTSPADKRPSQSLPEAQTASDNGATTGHSEALKAPADHLTAHTAAETQIATSHRTGAHPDETKGHQGKAVKTEEHVSKHESANADVAETNLPGALGSVASNLTALHRLGASFGATGTQPDHSAKACITSHGRDTLMPEATVPSSRSPAVNNAAKRPAPPPPLRLVLGTCSEIAVFTPDPIHDWPSLIRAADKIRPMTGISDSAWHDAKSAMGAEQASATLCAMLQRFSEIRNPGGYLRHLAKKAREGTFSPTRMVMALEHRAA